MVLAVCQVADVAAASLRRFEPVSVKLVSDVPAAVKPAPVTDVLQVNEPARSAGTMASESGFSDGMPLVLVDFATNAVEP